MTSETSAPSIPARLRDSATATFPNSCAGNAAKAPLKEPTGVRAALTMTMSSFISQLLSFKSGEGFEQFRPALAPVPLRSYSLGPCGRHVNWTQWLFAVRAGMAVLTIVLLVSRHAVVWAI